MTPRLSIGIGCSSRATVENILFLVQTVVAEIPSGSVLATLDRRASVGQSVAASLGLPLMLFSAKVLAQVPGTTSRSARAASETGTSSVAEAAALAALGPSAQLTVTRQTGRLCTCAVAVLS